MALSIAFLGYVNLGFWLLKGLEWLVGMSRIPWLRHIQPQADTAVLPRVSVIIPARDEAPHVEQAVRSMIGQTYASLEVIAVDDRSTDKTGGILDRLASQLERLTILHVKDLPHGWLGKTHAIACGAGHSKGDWLLFTDADIIYDSLCLARAMAYAERENLDHLTAVPDLIVAGFWEKAFVSCFAILMTLMARPWRVQNPRSQAYMGIGAFNLIRRSAYEAIGTHKALALEMADDMKLGKLVKASGLRSAVIYGHGLLRVRWVKGWRGAVQSLTKNMFAGLEFKLSRVILAMGMLLTLTIWPFLGVIVASGPAQLAYATSLGMILAMYACHRRYIDVPASYALSLPVATGLFAYIIVRSTYLALRCGAVEWRGTRYPLEVLKRGIV